MEAIYQDRDQFAQLVREVASPDVGKMGIEILSFTIKDIYDNVEYLASLGRAQTANVKRDAAIGVAEANRDAGIRVNAYFIAPSPNTHTHTHTDNLLLAHLVINPSELMYDIIYHQRKVISTWGFHQKTSYMVSGLTTFSD